MYRILMVDDERSTLEVRSHFLREKGCQVTCVTTGVEAVACVKSSLYDCILLDVMLFDTSGFSLCDDLRKITDTPIIFLSNLSDDENQLEGFFSGGADYITKGASLPLFWAKVETRIKLSKADRQTLTFGPLSIDLSARKVYLVEEEIILTSLEFDILVLLAGSPHYVFSVSAIYREVWGTDSLDRGQTVQVHMSHMRRKLEKAFPTHYFIETVWGKGYQFIPPPPTTMEE